MPVSLQCPAGHRVTVSRRYAGRMVRCPECGEKVRIPSRETLDRKLQEKRLSRSTLAPPPLPARSEAHAEPPPETAPTPSPPPITPTPPEAALAALDDSVDEAPTQPPGVLPASAAAPVRAYQPERGRRWTCYGLAISLALIGLFGAAPAVLEIAEYSRSDQSIPVARWAWLLLLAAMVQIAYAFYAMQMPDWSTAWVITLVGATLATLYAFLLGLTLLAGEESRIVNVLDLGEQLPHGRAARWCFVMLGVLGLYAYFSGRTALHWRRAFYLRRGNGVHSLRE